MDMVIKFIRLLILVASFYGYVQFLRKKVKLEFSIGIIFVSVGSVMFLAGILNVMKEIAIIICFCGLLLSFLSVYEKESVRCVISAGTIFFGITCIFFVALLYGDKFTNYDNFSHWALVLKVLMRENRFPNFMDTDIMFQSYPLGSASFIYYVCKILGVHAEWLQMYAQAMLMSGILVSLFAFSKKWQSNLLLGMGNIILLAGNTSITALLVDSLLPIIALGGIAFCIYYKNNLQDKLWWIIPYITFLISVKNSGIFFVIVILIYALTVLKNDKKSLKQWFCVMLSPLLILLLWQKHVKLVFDNGLMAKHSMSFSNFESVFEKKGWESITTIFFQVIENTFSVSNHILIIVIFIFLLWLFEQRQKEKVNKNSIKEIACIIAFSYMAYQLSLLGMYLFTMPLEEAVVLASYSRYHDTILLFAAGIFLVGGIRVIETSYKQHRNGIWVSGMLSIVCCICVFLTITPNFAYYKKQELEGTPRQQYDRLLSEYNIQPSKRHLIIKENEYADTGYLYFMVRYLFNTVNVSVVSVSDVQGEKFVLDDYDYVIIDSKEKEVVEYVEDKFPDQLSQKIPYVVMENVSTCAVGK